MAYKGIYKVKNKHKYKGDPTAVVYRSLLERTFMVWLDMNESILEWESEEFCIPYISPKDGKLHRYFPDFRIKHLTKNKTIANTLIEIKPKVQTEAPKEPKKDGKKYKRRYLSECLTWGINNAKWEAAKNWCAQNNHKFVILTEKDIRNFSGGTTPYRKRKTKKSKKDDG